MHSLQWNVYKGKGGKWGAVQFNLGDPYFYNTEEKLRDYTGEMALEKPGSRKTKPGWKEKEGCIFMSISSATAPDKYDWENQITMALNIGDMSKILLALLTGDKCSIMHDPHAQSKQANTIQKVLLMESPNGLKEGIFLTVIQKAAGDEKKHRVPLTGDEVVTLKVLLDRAITRALNW